MVISYDWGSKAEVEEGGGNTWQVGGKEGWTQSSPET